MLQVLDNKAVNLGYFEELVFMISEGKGGSIVFNETDKEVCKSALKELKQHRAYFNHSAFMHEVIRK